MPAITLLDIVHPPALNLLFLEGKWYSDCTISELEFQRLELSKRSCNCSPGYRSSVVFDILGVVHRRFLHVKKLKYTKFFV